MKRTLAAVLPLSIGLSFLAPACGGIDQPQGDPCGSSRTTMRQSVPAKEDADTAGPFGFGICLQRTPDIAAGSGAAACIVIEARNTMGACDCASEDGRVDVASGHEGVIEEAKASDAGREEGWDCFCEIPQVLVGEKQMACQNDTEITPVVGGEPVRGWCYVDATLSPPMGNPELMEMCPQQEKRVVRFVGQRAEPVQRSFFLMCETNACEADAPSGG